MYIHICRYLVLLHFFFLTIMTITMHVIKLIMTKVDIVPAIAGDVFELEEDDEPFIGGDSITVRVIHMHICTTILITSTVHS